MAVCIVCKSRPAAVPDRNRMGKPTKRVCRECHRERLAGDIAKIIEHEVAKRKSEREVVSDGK